MDPTEGIAMPTYDSEDREMIELREHCLAFIAAATRQHNDRRTNGTTGPTDEQLADIKTLVEMAGLQHMDERALTMIGLMAGIAGIVISMTDNQELLQLMILDTARQSAEAAASDGETDDR